MLSATAAADQWKAWLDDLPLPFTFDPAIGRLQDFITALTTRLDVPQPANEADRLAAANAALEAQVARLVGALDGNRPIPFDRETAGQFVREAWVRWAHTQPSPKASWLVPYDDLNEADKEADRQIGEALARWTLIHDAAALAEVQADARRDGEGRE